MVRQVTSLLLMAALLSAVPSKLPAQTSSTPHPISVIEVRAQAVLGQKSIRLELPLSDRASGSERAIAWVLFPANVVSGETTDVLKTGVQAAALTLPWPSEA